MKFQDGPVSDIPDDGSKIITNFHTQSTIVCKMVS